MQLQARASRKAVKKSPGQKVSQKWEKTARSVKHKSISLGKIAGLGLPGRVQCPRCMTLSMQLFFNCVHLKFGTVLESKLCMLL